MEELFDVLVETTDGMFVTIIRGLPYGQAMEEAESWEELDDNDVPYSSSVGPTGIFNKKETQMQQLLSRP